jgi:hypothetical protein
VVGLVIQVHDELNGRFVTASHSRHDAMTHTSVSAGCKAGGGTTHRQRCTNTQAQAHTSTDATAPRGAPVLELIDGKHGTWQRPHTSPHLVSMTPTTFCGIVCRKEDPPATTMVRPCFVCACTSRRAPSASTAVLCRREMRRKQMA